MYDLWVAIGIIGFVVMVIGDVAGEHNVWAVGMQLVATAAFFMAMYAKRGKKLCERDSDRESDEERLEPRAGVVSASLLFDLGVMALGGSVVLTLLGVVAWLIFAPVTP